MIKRRPRIAYPDRFGSFIPIIAGAIVSVGITGQAHATTYTWSNALNGEYRDTANWSPGGGAPINTNDTAIFSPFGAYTVDFESFFSEVDANNFEVTAGTVTFDMYESQGLFSRSYDYNLASTTAAAHIGGAPGSFFATKLILDGGVGNDGVFSGRSRVTTDGFIHIGRDANSTGILELDGAAWVSTNTTFVGLNGTGTLNIKSGGLMSNSVGLVGFGLGSTGVVTIDAFGDWDNSGDLSVGVFGTGTVTVDGSLLNQGAATIAPNGGAVGTVNLNGSWNSQGSLYVGGGSISAGGSANLNINNGFLNVGGDMRVYSTASFTFNDGDVNVTDEFEWLKPTTLTLDNADDLSAGTLTIGAGGSLDIDGPIGFNPHLSTGQINAPAGSMTWDAGWVEITNGGSFDIDDTAPIGDFVILRDDQRLDVDGALRVGVGGEGGLLFLVDGVQVTSGSGEIGNTNPASSTSPIAVEGPTSSWTMTGDLSMGNVAGSGAQLSVTQAATVTNADAFVSPNVGLHSEILVQSSTTTSLWDSTGSVYLGGNASAAGGTANVLINPGGSMAVGTELRIWDGAVLTVDGGTLTTPLINHSGTFNYTGTLDLTGSGPITALDLNGGTVNADEIDYGSNNLMGFGELNGEVTVGGDVTATGSLTLGDASSLNGVQITGDLNVLTHHVTLNKLGFFTLDTSTNITGGTLTLSDGAAIPTGQGLSGHGTVQGRIAQQLGSTIVTTGNLTMGDPASNSGFSSEGEIIVNANDMLIIHDADLAVLGSLTTLNAGSKLGAANGILLEAGKNIAGTGEIDTPNDPTKPLNNLGVISGNSAAEPITLGGYVTGTGSLDHVLITGIDAPGTSPATVSRGSVSYAGTLEIEIGGNTLGSFDRIEHSGIATLGGVLDLSIINGFTPALGQTFQFITASSIVGTFSSLVGADLGGGLTLDVLYSPNDVTLEVIDASLQGDLNGDGFVGIDDLNIVLANWNLNVPPGNPLADPSGDGFVGIDDLNTVLGNWNAGTPPADTINTPEPGSSILLGVGAAGLLRRRH